jgi:hemoglobin
MTTLLARSRPWGAGADSPEPDVTARLLVFTRRTMGESDASGQAVTRDPDTAVSSALRLKRDLGSRGQIHDLVVRFYREIVFDDLLGPVFEEVAEVDWSTHIPKLIDYWCRVLLSEPGYDGYILHAHQEVHQIESFRPELFDRWYLLFVEAIDAGWEGPVAERAKTHAARMAGVLSGRLLGAEWIPPCGRTSTAG